MIEDIGLMTRAFFCVRNLKTNPFIGFVRDLT